MYNFVLSAFADEIDASLIKQIEVLKKHGISYIELRSIEGNNVSSFDIDYAKEVKAILDSEGIKVSAIGSPIGKIKLDGDIEIHFDVFRHVIKLAKIFETRYIRLFSFYAPENKDIKECKVEVIKNMKKMVEIAKDSNVILLHENEKGIYGESADACYEILSEINAPNLRATFDPANFVQCKQEVYPTAYNLLKPYIEYIHIKDAKFETGEVVPAGYGDGQVKALIEQLKKDDFNGFLSLEPHLGNFAGFADLELDDDGSGKEQSDENKFALAANSLKALI